MQLTSQPLSLPDLLRSRYAIMLLADFKNRLCVNSDGRPVVGQTLYRIVQCDLTNYNQVFVYDPTTFQIKSATKSSPCLQTDDGPGTDISIMKCKTTDLKLAFKLDGGTSTIRNTAKKNSLLCFSGREWTTTGAELFVAPCRLADKNQWFEAASFAKMCAFVQHCSDCCIVPGITHLPAISLIQSLFILLVQIHSDTGDTVLEFYGTTTPRL